MADDDYNDYHQAADDLRRAIREAESVEPIDPDIEDLVSEGIEKLEDAKKLAEQRA